MADASVTKITPAPRQEMAPRVSEAFLRSVIRWEEEPHNRDGSDKSWVERVVQNWNNHYRAARPIRR